LTAVGGGARVGGGAGMVLVYALPCGVGAFGAWRDHSYAGGTARIVRVTVSEGDHHGLADHHVFTGSAVCGAAARLGSVRRGLKYRTTIEAALEPEPPTAHRVGWGFISLYALAYMSTSLLFIAPLLVTLPLKVNSLVGIKQAPDSLALVAGVGALLALVGNPFFGRMSDRTASRLGMRRPWMVTGLVGGSLGILIVAFAPNIAVVLAGWCIAQLLFNALLAAMVAVLPDQVPSVQRGLVSGILGVCLPVASVCGTFLVKLFTGNMLAMFLVPCAIGGFSILLFGSP
jgi:Major Facilitator Superfamily